MPEFTVDIAIKTATVDARSEGDAIRKARRQINQNIEAVTVRPVVAANVVGFQPSDPARQAH